VLGADDGIVSVASLLIGVAASHAARSTILLAGTAGLVAGALSMAAGEYVSVGSQRDAERADIARETGELAGNPDAELRELTQIYIRRGLEPDLAERVAEDLTRRDALGSHLRDELGLTEAVMARPLQAALVSAVSFAVGAFIPILAMLLSPEALRIAVIGSVALVLLASLGALGGRIGGASPGRAALRVTVGGSLAMALTAVIGRLVGAIGL
jgi:VIT1/CCC1 family predicted Fe2+/Mn2+ transporter